MYVIKFDNLYYSKKEYTRNFLRAEKFEDKTSALQIAETLKKMYDNVQILEYNEKFLVKKYISKMTPGELFLTPNGNIFLRLKQYGKTTPNCARLDTGDTYFWEEEYLICDNTGCPIIETHTGEYRPANKENVL